MNEEPPQQLDYASAELPRPYVPPDGYLGHRDEKSGPGWDVVMFAVLAFVTCVFVLLWLVGRWWAAAWA